LGESRQKELQTERRLPRSWIAVDQIDVIAGEATAEDCVEAGDACPASGTAV
jgi:hypothetical protein